MVPQMGLNATVFKQKKTARKGGLSGLRLDRLILFQ